MHSRYLEGFAVGDVFVTRAATFTDSDIVDFALKYDPQPMHIDAHSAAAGPFGSLIASGFRTLALSFLLWADLGLFADTNIAAPVAGPRADARRGDVGRQAVHRADHRHQGLGP